MTIRPNVCFSFGSAVFHYSAKLREHFPWVFAGAWRFCDILEKLYTPIILHFCKTKLPERRPGVRYAISTKQVVENWRKWGEVFPLSHLEAPYFSQLRLGHDSCWTFMV